jgi:hypothetical protein
LRWENSDLCFPMEQFCERQVFHHWFEILRELTNKAWYIQVSIDSVWESEVISLGKDLNTVREITLSTYTFLEGGTGSSSAINFSVEKTDNNKLVC